MFFAVVAEQKLPKMRENLYVEKLRDYTRQHERD